MRRGWKRNKDKRERKQGRIRARTQRKGKERALKVYVRGNWGRQREM